MDYNSIFNSSYIAMIGVVNLERGYHVIPHLEVENKPERDAGRSMGFGNTAVGHKFISTFQ